MAVRYLKLVHQNVPVTKHVCASTVSLVHNFYRHLPHPVFQGSYVSMQHFHGLRHSSAAINMCQAINYKFSGNNVDICILKSKQLVCKSLKLFRFHNVSIRNLSNIARPIVSFEPDSLLKKYLDNVMENYTSQRQERDALLDSVDQSYVDAVRVKVDQLNVKLSQLEPIVSLFGQHRQLVDDVEQLNEIVKDSTGTDGDLCKMAKTDILNLQGQLSVIETDIVDLLVPSVFGDQNDIILEVSAGVGGQEAMFFTKELFEMYTKYADFKHWSTDVVECELSDLGGVRRAMACISGNNVFMRMKYEGGVHRVQRVPKTEKSGRVHTSTATVAVMARPSEVEVVLNPKDLRIDTCRASGKGGQHVNTTDSAVRIVHLPTGVSAECQTERSQIRNKETAMKVLRTRLYEKEMEVKMKEQSSSRKLQVGSAGRSEKIRTYNVKDDRITDHRLDENMYGVQGLLEGAGQLDELIDMLQAESRRERLLEVIQKLEPE